MSDSGQRSKPGGRSIGVWLVLLAVLALVATACQGGTPAQSDKGEKLKVFGAFATQIEEPWDGVIHAALEAEKAAGRIDYTFQDDIGYSGDMERVLREVADSGIPVLIVSSDGLELEGLCDRVVIFSRGQVVGERVPDLPGLPGGADQFGAAQFGELLA